MAQPPRILNRNEFGFFELPGGGSSASSPAPSSATTLSRGPSSATLGRGPPSANALSRSLPDSQSHLSLADARDNSRDYHNNTIGRNRGGAPTLNRAPSSSNVKGGLAPPPPNHPPPLPPPSPASLSRKPSSGRGFRSPGAGNGYFDGDESSISSATTVVTSPTSYGSNIATIHRGARTPPPSGSGTLAYVGAPVPTLPRNGASPNVIPPRTKSNRNAPPADHSTLSRGRNAAPRDDSPPRHPTTGRSASAGGLRRQRSDFDESSGTSPSLGRRGRGEFDDDRANGSPATMGRRGHGDFDDDRGNGGSPATMGRRGRGDFDGDSGNNSSPATLGRRGRGDFDDDRGNGGSPATMGRRGRSDFDVDRGNGAASPRKIRGQDFDDMLRDLNDMTDNMGSRGDKDAVPTPPVRLRNKPSTPNRRNEGPQRIPPREESREQRDRSLSRGERDRGGADLAPPRPAMPHPKRPLPSPATNPPASPVDISRIERPAPVDETVVDPQYIRALMEFLISDPTTTPSPDDFPDPEEGYLLWGDRIGTSIQEHLCSLLEARYLHPEGKGRKRPLPPHAGPNGAPALSEKKPVGGSGTMVDVFFKIVGGQGLLCKPGSEAHCKVEFGYLPDDTPGAPPSMPPLPGEDTIKISLGTENSPVKRQDDGGGFVVWNQHVNLPATNLTDAVMISVFEKGSGKMIGGEDVFLGRHRIAISDLITTSAKEGYVERWCELRGRPNGKKDKSVGGEVLVEFTIHHDDKQKKETQKPSASAPSNMDPELPLRRLQSATTILSPPLYRVLMRAAVECDLHNRPPLLVTPPPPNRRGGATGGPPGSMSVRDDYLSPLSLQARTVLEVYGREWGMRDATCTLILLEALSDACDAALVAMGGKEVGGGRMFGGTVYQRRLLETIRVKMKGNDGWLSEADFPIVVQLLERIHLAYVRNLQTYRDFYPRNQPRGAVETAILILRLIHKNTLFREESGVGRAEPDSFRTALRNIMTQASITRYGQLQELSAPLDRTDILQTLDSITEFVNLLKADIEEDSAHFDEGFMANKEDLKMSKLTSETYLKCLVLTLEDLSEVIAGEEVVKIPGVASKVFDVYMILRGLEEKYGKLVPSLKRTSVSGGFSLERWFHPFVQMWLKHLGTQTVIWVDNALRADDFSPLPGTEGDVLPYSSSIRDVYSAIYAELDVVLGLVGEDNNNNGKKGGNGRQGSAKFLQIFAKVVNQALEHYCDRIISSEAVAAKPGVVEKQPGTEEKKAGEGEWTLWETVATTAQTVINAATGGKNSGGKDISMESCIKLCNLVYAMNRLEDLQKTMNVEAVSRRQEEFYRRTLAPMIRRYRAVSRYYPADEKYGSVKGEMKAEDDSGANMIPVRGAFKVEVVYAENVKGCKGNGMANPYVMVRVPEGSVMEREELVEEGEIEEVEEVEGEDGVEDGDEEEEDIYAEDGDGWTFGGENGGNGGGWGWELTKKKKKKVVKKKAGGEKGSENLLMRFMKMAGRDDDEDSEGASPSASTPEKREPAAKGKAVIKMVKKRLRGKECELLRTRPNYDTLNPTFDEAFDVMLPEVERLEVGVLSKVGVVEGVALSGDEVVGFGSVNLAGSMRSKLMDHQTHEVWVDLEPQGRVLLRITMEGDGETVEYWFKKTNRRFIRNRNDLVRSLAGRLVPYCRKVLLQVVKGEEQAPQKGFLKAIGATAAPVKLEDVDPDEITTAAGVPIDQDMTFREIAVVLKPMEDYLDKNFATICEWLTPTGVEPEAPPPKGGRSGRASVANSGKSLLLAQETIQRVWEELVEHCLKNMLVPPLYGQIEKDRKVLNKRQVSAVHSLLHRLRDFFYADGEGFGLPLKVLESPLTFGRLEAIVKSYYAGRPTSEMLPKVQKEYENSLLAERLGTKGSPKALKPGGTLGRGVAVGEKEYLLRIVRLRAERGEDLTDAERTEAKGWLDSQLVSRKKDTGAR